MKTWSLVGSVASTNDVTLLVDDRIGPALQRYYRLVQPGFSAEQGLARWTSNNAKNYQFRLQRVIQDANPKILTALITIQDGIKKMTEPKANDQPLTDFKADDFPSIEQIYAMLIKAQQTGCWRVAIIYDPIKYYPAWSVIETLKPDIVADSKQIESFQISDLK